MEKYVSLHPDWHELEATSIPVIQTHSYGETAGTYVSNEMHEAAMVRATAPYVVAACHNIHRLTRKLYLQRKKRTHQPETKDPAKKGDPKSFVFRRGRHGVSATHSIPPLLQSA